VAETSIGAVINARLNMSSEYELNLLKAFCKGKGVNIGCGKRPIANAINIDLMLTSKADVIASAECLPLPSKHYDFLVSLHCLEHVEQAPLLVLIEWLRVLKVGGTLAFIVPNGDDGLVALGGYPSSFGEGNHVHLFTVPVIKTLLEYAGGKNITIEVINRTEWTTTSLLVTAKKNRDNTGVKPNSIKARAMHVRNVSRTVTLKGLLKWFVKRW